MSFFCTNCHASLEPEYRFCAQCGHAVYRNGRSTLWIHLGWAAFSTLILSGAGGALWFKQHVGAQAARTVILKTAEQVVAVEEPLNVQKDPELIELEPVVVSAAELKPHRWKAVRVDVSSAEDMAQQWGVHADFLIQPIELTEGLVAALQGDTSRAQKPQDLSIRELQAIADQLSVIDGYRPCYSASVSGCNGWRIPERGEWMVAAHAGQYTSYSGSDRLSDVSGPEKEVGRYAPNALGVYDMTGSALEWVSAGGGFGVIGTEKPLAQQDVMAVEQMDKRIKGVGGRLVRSL